MYVWQCVGKKAILDPTNNFNQIKVSDSPSTVDEEAVWPEEEAAGDVCRGGGARHGRPDEGVVPAAGATDLPHRLR